MISIDQLQSAGAESVKSKKNRVVQSNDAFTFSAHRAKVPVSGNSFRNLGHRPLLWSCAARSNKVWPIPRGPSVHGRREKPERGRRAGWL